MRKTLTLAAAGLATLAFAAPALADDDNPSSPTTLGAPVGAVSPISDDWGGHDQEHCNNLASPEYYGETTGLSSTGLVPGNPNKPDNGTSEYSIAPGGGADDCGSVEVVEATGYTNNSLPAPLGQYPEDEGNDRNPGGNTEGAYIATGDTVEAATGREVSAGQQGNVIP